MEGGDGAAQSQRPELPDGFQERVFKGTIWGEGCRGHDFFLIGWWWSNRVVLQKLSNQPSGSNPSRVHMFVFSILQLGWGSIFCRAIQRYALDCYIYTPHTHTHRRCRLDPWVGMIPWQGNGNPLQYSCLKIPTDRGASRLPFMGSESDAAEQLSRQIPWRGRKALCCLVAQWSLTLCDPMDCSPRGSSLHGVFQARILEWVAISSSKASSWLRDWTLGFSVFCVASGFFTTEPPGKGLLLLDCFSLVSALPQLPN